jgi:hypothetical protein
MSISNGVVYLLSTSTIAGTTAAKAALTRLVFGAGALTALASFVAVITGLRKAPEEQERRRRGRTYRSIG